MSTSTSNSSGNQTSNSGANKQERQAIAWRSSKGKSLQRYRTSRECPAGSLNNLGSMGVPVASGVSGVTMHRACRHHRRALFCLASSQFTACVSGIPYTRRASR
jgi:hypothetical protein